MVGGQQSTRSIQHLSELFRLADAAGLLRDPDLAVARMRALLATHGALAVSRVIAREKAANLAKAVSTNREIGMAMGVLMTTYKVTEDQAFDLLRIASQHSHRKLADVALDVCDTGMLDYPPALPAS